MTDSEITFVLTNGGHNAGIVSEPGHPDRHYRVARKAADASYTEPTLWFANARLQDGSWWPEWVRWLDAHSGKSRKPPRLGAAGREYAAIADAPGTYVLQR